MKSFAEKMTDILNHGALNLAMGLGYRTHLFDVMDEFDGPQPASVIAKTAGLSPRYVREWLGIMVTGEIVELSRDPDGTPDNNTEGTDLFFLPVEHGDVLTRRAGNANLGVYTQEIPLLTQCAMAPVLEGFSSGRGVSYDHYPEFQAFMTQLADAKHQAVLVDTFLPAVDQGKVLAQMQDGVRVCDLGCGEGVALILMAEAFPQSNFVGIDISSEAIEKATHQAAAKGLSNLSFHCLDAADPGAWKPFVATFDYITAFDAIHDQNRPQAALQGVHAMLKPGGAFSMVDIAADSRLAENAGHPLGPFLYAVSLMHCMPVGLADSGRGLGMMWGKQLAEQMLQEAGFTDCRIEPVPEDSFNLHFFCRKSPAG